MRVFLGIISVLFACSIGAQSRPIELDLSGQVGVGYSDNPYSLSNQQRAGRNVGDMIVQFGPQINLAAQGKRITLDLNGSGNFSWMTGLNKNPGFFIFNGDVGLDSTFNKEGSYSVYLGGNVGASRGVGELYIGNITSLNGAATLGGVVRAFHNRWALSLEGGYSVQDYLTRERSGQQEDLSGLSSHSYSISSRLSWLFLRKTSLFVETRYGFFDNVDAQKNAIKQNPFHVGGGLDGQITRRISASLAAYYSTVFTKLNGADLPIGSSPFGMTASLNWQYGSKSSLDTKFSREVQAAAVSLDQVRNSFQLGWNQIIGRKLNLSLNSQVGFLEYGKPFDAAPSAANRKDLYLGSGLSLSYSFNKWLQAGVSGSGEWRWTNSDPTLSLNKNSLVAAGGGSNYQALFNRYEGNVFVRFTY